MSHAARGPREGALGARRARVVSARVHGEAPSPAAPPAYEGLVTRGIAFVVDAALIDLTALIVAAAVALGLSVLSVPNEVETTLIAAAGTLFFVWTIAYFVVFWSTTGQTPGNRLLRIRVCRAEDHGALRPRQALLRLAALTLAAMPCFAGFVPILLDDRRRGLHDMIAGTVVVGADLSGAGSSAQP